MSLVLKADPTQLEAAAGRAEAALAGVKQEAVATESAIDRLGREAARDLAPMADTARRVAGSADEMARATDRVGQASRSSAPMVQNAAFQIGDMAVQIAGGVSPMRAMAQQLPQLLGGFGLIGAVLGGAVAVVAAVAPAFFDMATAAEEAATATEALGGALADLEDNYNAAVSLNREYVAAVKSGNEQLIQAIELEAQARQAQFTLDKIIQEEAAKTAKKAVDDQAASFAELSAKRAQAFGDLVEAQRTYDEAMANGGEFALEALSAVEAQRDTLAQINTEHATAEAALKRSTADYDLIAAQAGVLEAKMAANGDLIEIVKTGLDESAGAATSLAVAADGASVAFQGLAGWAAMANANIAAAANNAAALRAEAAASNDLPALSGPAGMGAPPPSGGAVSTSPRPGQRGVDSPAFELIRTGGGGASRAVEQVAEVTKELTGAERAMMAFQDAGTNALDRLIDGTTSLGEALKEMAKELAIAAAKQALLGSVVGGTDKMSLGGLLMQGLFAGFKDEGGAIPNGSFAVVGERGPELVRATPGGAMVTSRVDTARMMQPQSQNVHVTVSVDDDGKIKAMVSRAARSSAASAVDAVKRSLPTWNSMLAVDGALA